MSTSRSVLAPPSSVRVSPWYWPGPWQNSLMNWSDPLPLAAASALIGSASALFSNGIFTPLVHKRIAEHHEARDNRRNLLKIAAREYDRRSREYQTGKGQPHDQRIQDLQYEPHFRWGAKKEHAQLLLRFLQTSWNIELETTIAWTLRDLLRTSRFNLVKRRRLTRALKVYETQYKDMTGWEE